MSTTTTGAIAILTNYNQAQEDALALTLVGQGAGAAVIFNTDLNIARIWNGSAFTNTPIPTVDNSLVVVRQLSDFPTPSGGIITLADYTTYQISGTIDIGTNRIVCGIKNTILGLDRLNDILLSTTTGNMITMDSSVTPKLSLITNTVTLQCPNGTLFNITGGSANQLTLISTTINNTKNAGTLDGVAFSMRTSSMSSGVTTTGFVFTGTNTSLIIRDSTISNNAGTAFNVTNATFTSVIGISRNFILTNNTQTFFNGTNVSVTINGQIALNIFSGAGTQITGITAQTSLWDFIGNLGIANTANGNSQLIQTTSDGKYPALDGSLITNIPGSLSDGDKGDITVSGSGSIWTIDNLAVDNAKISDVAATKVTEDATHRFATDAEKTTWNNKLSANGNGGSLTGLTKTQVGLSNVDNTSDADKPISTATQSALDAKQATLISATNIKTINGNSILGSGDLEISGSGLTQQQVEGLI